MLENEKKVRKHLKDFIKEKKNDRNVSPLNVHNTNASQNRKKKIQIMLKDSITFDTATRKFIREERRNFNELVETIKMEEWEDNFIKHLRATKTATEIIIKLKDNINKTEIITQLSLQIS